MATFELNNNTLGRSGSRERFAGTEPVSAAVPDHACGDHGHGHIPPPRPVIQESIIALKIYDSCRQQDCLDDRDLGAARSAICQSLDGTYYEEGDIIHAPRRASTVDIEDFRTQKIIIAHKRHNTFKRGFWDVTLKYVFEYNLVFRDTDGANMGCLVARSTFEKRVTLFGSIGSEIVIATDLLNETDNSPVLSHDPFVLVEAKAVPLAAKIRECGGHHGANEISVTIGLFTIIKLYRIVTLSVESRGFDIPRHCDEHCPVNPCDHFDRQPFPMDVFAPPQRKEFEAGISGDIFKETFKETTEAFSAETE